MATASKKKAKKAPSRKTAEKTCSSGVSNAANTKKSQKNANKVGQAKPVARAQNKKKATLDNVQVEDDAHLPDYAGYNYGSNDYTGSDGERRYEEENQLIQSTPAVTDGQPTASTSLAESRVDRHQSTPPPIDFELQAEDLRTEVQKMSNQNTRLTTQNVQLGEELNKHIAEHESTRQAKYQAQVLDLKEAVKSLKRNAPDNDDEEPPARKAKKVKKAPVVDKYSHAEKAGKKFMANYCAFGDKEDIFEGFAEAAGEIVDSDEEGADDGSSDSDEQENNSSDDEEDEHADKSNKNSPYNFTTLEDREHFVKDSAVRFYNEAEAKEVDRWEDDEYQSRASTLSLFPHLYMGMSRMRGHFKDYHDDARVVFGLAIDAEDFAKKDRHRIPEVANLLKNTTFLAPVADGPGRSDRAFRHRCLLQICRSVLFGRKALVTGEKSAMARGLFSRQWRIKRMNIHIITFAAYISYFILLGEKSLNHADRTWDMYWTTLGILWGSQNDPEKSFVPELLDFYDKELNLNPAPEVEVVDEEQAALLAEITG